MIANLASGSEAWESGLDVPTRGLVGTEVPLGSGQGRDSLHSDTLESAFPEFNGQAPLCVP